jgi:hypothetical protein
LKYLSRYFAICQIFFGLNTSAQVVKFIKNPITAKHRVFITEKPNDADISVYKVQKYEEALSAGLWYVVDNPMLFKDAVTLFEVKKREEADLIVYYTNDRLQAGFKQKKKR